MNLKIFFDNIRESVFGGSLSQDQVDGCQRIIAYRDEHWPKMVNAELAYLLATAEWETGHSLHPVEEGFPLHGDALREYQKKLRYYPAYGRGLVQTTWPANYARLGLNSPEDYPKALEWDYALRFLFEGMIYGWFTGRKLADYITAKRQDYVNARRIVNGLDKAERIAKNARAFHAALLKAASAKSIEKPAPELIKIPSPVPAQPSMWERISDALEKLGAQPATSSIRPSPIQIPSPNATPSPDLIAVANRIEQRQIVMLQMLEEKFAAYDAKLDAIKARMDELQARAAASVGTLTPEQQAEIDSLSAKADSLGAKLDALAAS